MPQHNYQSGISDTWFFLKLYGVERDLSISNLIEPKLFLIGDWCKACIDQKREGGCFFYLEGVEREQHLNASGRDCVLPPHQISAAKFWQLAAIFNRFWPDDCQKGAFSSFGVFNFQRLQETFSAQSWCAAVVNLRKWKAVFKPPLCRIRLHSKRYLHTSNEKWRLLLPGAFEPRLRLQSVRA